MSVKDVLARIEGLWNDHPKGKQLDEKGREILDPRPVEPPVGYVRQPTMVEHIRAMVRSELLARDLRASGVETFEEADDFDVGDPEDLHGAYEVDFEPDPADPALAPPAAAAQPPKDPPGAAPAAPGGGSPAQPGGSPPGAPPAPVSALT